VTKLTIEEVIEWLKAVDHHSKASNSPISVGVKLFYAEEHWLTKEKNQKKAESSGTVTTTHNKQPHKKGKFPRTREGAAGERKMTQDDIYQNCSKADHWAKDCRKPKHRDQVHITKQRRRVSQCCF
jgi:hypothetical protein